MSCGAYILIQQRIHYYYSYYYYYYYNIYYHTNTTTTTILPLLLLGVTETVDLIPGGGDVTVDSTNLADYLDAQMKYRTLHRIETQLAEMLKGFYDVVPEPLLSVFDFQVGVYICHLYSLTLPLSLLLPYHILLPLQYTYFYHYHYTDTTTITPTTTTTTTAGGGAAAARAPQHRHGRLGQEHRVHRGVRQLAQ